MARVRIVGGQWRSRLLQVMDDQVGLRPTPDRVRETLFNWLGQDLTGQSCLDLFAGSGILGFEAASRGATRVTLVEHAARVFAALQRNARLLQAAPTGQEAGATGPRLELVRADALKYAAAQATPYDVVFLDPPYHQGWLERIAPHLPRLTHAGSRLYVEAEHPVDALAGWQAVRRGQAGQVHFQLLEQP